MNTREHAVKVSLNSEELARLDRARGSAERAVYLRTLLYEPPNITEIASHKEALAILSRLARAGGTAAAIALERNALSRRPQTAVEAGFCGAGCLTARQGVPEAGTPSP